MKPFFGALAIVFACHSITPCHADALAQLTLESIDSGTIFSSGVTTDGYTGENYDTPFSQSLFIVAGSQYKLTLMASVNMDDSLSTYSASFNTQLDQLDKIDITSHETQLYVSAYAYPSESEIKGESGDGSLSAKAEQMFGDTFYYAYSYATSSSGISELSAAFHGYTLASYNSTGGVANVLTTVYFTALEDASILVEGNVAAVVPEASSWTYIILAGITMFFTLQYRRTRRCS